MEVDDAVLLVGLKRLDLNGKQATVIKAFDGERYSICTQDDETMRVLFVNIIPLCHKAFLRLQVRLYDELFLFAEMQKRTRINMPRTATVIPYMTLPKREMHIGIDEHNFLVFFDKDGTMLFRLPPCKRLMIGAPTIVVVEYGQTIV